MYEAKNTWDDYWDTTFTVLPTQNWYSQFLAIDGVSEIWSRPRSQTGYRSVHLEGDHEFAILTGGFPSWLSARRPSDYDTSWLLPGDFGIGQYVITSADDSVVLRITPRSCQTVLNDLIGMHRTLPDDVTTVYGMPSNSSISLNSTSRIPGCSRDGVGGVVTSNKPVAVYFFPFRYGWTGEERSVAFLEQVVSPKNAGCDYVLVPFQKPAIAQWIADTVRVIALNDSTQLEISSPQQTIQLNYGGYFDMSLNSPTLLHATQPIAVYQMPPSCGMMKSDSIEAGGALAHIPMTQWGRHYYCFSEIMFIPEAWQRNQWLAPDSSIPHTGYLCIIARWEQRGNVTLNGTPIDTTQYTRILDYGYLVLPRPPRFDLVESTDPILVLAYGFNGSTNSGIVRSGYSYVPIRR